ncbi:MAG: hypothetical protein V3T69_10900 [Acidiferrobacterales bacterium]
MVYLRIHGELDCEQAEIIPEAPIWRIRFRLKMEFAIIRIPVCRYDGTRMHANWNVFLHNAGAIVKDGMVQHFGDPDVERQAAAKSTVLADLSSRSLIRARGNDVKDFLQGQLTNDISLVDAAHSTISAYCNSKGRMLAIFRIFMREQTFLLELPLSMRDTIMQRLRLYILRANVTLDSADDELQRLGIAGPQAEAILRQELGHAPEKDDDSCSISDNVTLIRVRGHQPRFEVMAPVQVAQELWRQFRGRATAVGAPVWAWLDIEAGIPNVYPETSEAFVPQMANLELVGGVSFDKGCYVGQEIIARIQSLGRLKQRMYRLHAMVDTIPQRGEAIYAPNLLGQSSGSVVDAQPSPDGGYDMLAVVHISSAKAGELYLGRERGPQLTVQALPYPLTSAQ